MSDDLVFIERDGSLAHLILNRPSSLNALSSGLADAVIGALMSLNDDDEIRCVILRGTGKGFAAGADISEMASRSAADMIRDDYFSEWDTLLGRRVPLVAAVHGFALGGGCELAMMCDIVVAAEGAKFGQPEVKLGVMPGMGGTQRLTRLVGRMRAMDLILTGRTIDAAEAERIGLVSRVVAKETLLSTATEIAEIIAGISAPAIGFAREAIDRAEDVSLSDGLRFERRSFHSLFAGADQKEGMSAFLEKRPPNFTHR